MIEKVKQNIKEEIKRKGTTSEKLCRTMKQGRKFISNMTEEVKLSKILMICEALECKPGDILNNLK